MNRGDKYRPVVTVLKVKNGVPTVIRVSGREYVFRPKDQYGNRKKGAKARKNDEPRGKTQLL
jgi:hypothetical protein